MVGAKVLEQPQLEINHGFTAKQVALLFFLFVLFFFLGFFFQSDGFFKLGEFVRNYGSPRGTTTQ